MKHSVIFDGCDNHWDNALPFGNGVFGCMLFYEDDRLYMPMNHYEVYYNISKRVLPEDIYNATGISNTPGALHKSVRERADFNRPPEGQPFCLYRTDRDKGRDYGIAFLSRSHPCTGELVFSFSDKLKNAHQRLSLYTEDAKGELILENESSDSLTLETITARCDCIINTVKQSESGLLREIKISFPEYRDADAPTVVYEQHDDNTISYTVTRLLSGEKPFVFSGALKFKNAKIKIKEICATGADISIIESKKEFSIITGIFTDWKYKDLPADAVSGVSEYAENSNMIISEHKKYWHEFFNRSSITLPDKFLEKVYTVNQYALDCCSGKDGVMKHHACGLNGLWDIRHPNLWGSLWYWDVNIQAAFAGVFSSNRLDLAKVFSDGLQCYTKLGERSAYNVHNLPGCATDYPYTFYYCCWSWCAQYLWFLYEYSLDEDYLRNEAYPLFLKLCEFTVGIFEYDESRDEYVVYPDISPEQGPLAHNTVITVSCAKYMFKFTLKAAEILGDDHPILKDCRRILEKMPAYPLSGPSKYGIHFRDSEDAPDDLWIRHPSMLMPVFPIGELDIDSDPETVQIISNTLDFLEENCEIGVFPCSWIAAAGARIGRGQFAYRTLYEKGIDHLLRSNGLTAEETDRFMNYCLIGRQPLYYPCMMEFTGEMLVAVNEMLIQSHNDMIRIFPAIPDGDKEYGRSLRNGYSYSDYNDRYIPYDAWKDVRFDKLLAKGAFEVTAEMKDGSLDLILIHSKKGGKVNVTSPFMPKEISVFSKGAEIDFVRNGDVLSFDTEAGNDYLISSSKNIKNEISASSEEYDNEVTSRMTYTRRRLYVGEDTETRYQKQLDSVLRDWYLGNARQSNHTLYKFDLGTAKNKEYESEIPLQAFPFEGHLMRGMDFVRLGADNFTAKKGYGFADASGIKVCERQGPDQLRYDFVEGENDAEFIIEAPRGQYEMLVISGDSEEDSVTIARMENSRKIGGALVKKGRFQSEIIPFIQERDVPIRLHLSTVPGYKWKLNAIILNVIRGY